MRQDEVNVWDKYLAQGGKSHPIVKHMFLDYSRYHEADLIIDTLGDRLKVIKVLDYGCGVGDYGIQMLRKGCKSADFWDFPRATNFVDFRLKTEDLKGKAINADKNPHPKFGGYDLVIFGEVLEHLHDPFKILKAIDKAKVPYVFTSSYPYRSDDPDDPYWNNHDHDDDARLQMPQCRELLENNYTYTKYDGELRLWERK